MIVVIANIILTGMFVVSYMYASEFDYMHYSYE
jgi:hypothetical protein